MSELKRILLIDDDCGKFKDDLSKSFDKENIEITFCQTKDEGLKEIDSGSDFDVLILDWFLEDKEDSLLSQLVLKHLINKLFIPVFIWSNHFEDFTSKVDSGEVDYPKILIDGISKAEVSPENIKTKINDMVGSSTPAKISKIYRRNIRSNLEKIFFELSELSEGDIASILKILVGTEENIDWSNDFVLNLIHRKLLADTTFIEELKALIGAADDNPSGEEPDKRRKMINKVLYYQGTPSIIRCGDIIKIEKDGEIHKYGIVATPDCDIQQKNSCYLEIVEMRKIEDGLLGLNNDTKEKIKKYKEQSYYFFPSIKINGNLENDFVAIFKSKFIVKGLYDDNTEKYPKVPEALSYSGKFQYDGEEVQLLHICSKSNPYKSDFLQNLHAHNSRVGTPDIKKLLRP